MSQLYKNISGGPVSLPVQIEYDVEPDQIVEVADDVLLPPTFFELQP